MGSEDKTNLIADFQRSAAIRNDDTRVQRHSTTRFHRQQGRQCTSERCSRVQNVSLCARIVLLRASASSSSLSAFLLVVEVEVPQEVARLCARNDTDVVAQQLLLQELLCQLLYCNRNARNK